MSTKRAAKVAERKRVERKRAAKARRVAAQPVAIPPEEIAAECHVCHRPVSYFDKALLLTCVECSEDFPIHARCCPECNSGRVVPHDHVEVDLTAESRW